MNYRDLQMFLTLTSIGNMGRAAEQLHMSPSTLSRRLAAMEREMGISLIARDSQPLSLTEAGRRFSQYAEQTLYAWDALRQELNPHVSELSGSLTLFCSVTASFSVLPEILARFRERYPAVDLRILTGDAEESIPRVESGDADLVIAARPEQLLAGLTFKALLDSPLLFIAPRHASAVPGLHPGEPDWSSTPMILSATGLARTRIDQWFVSKNIQPNVYAQVSGNEAIVSMVALGVGIGVVPELVLRNSPAAGRVRILPVEPELEPFLIGLCVQTRCLDNPLIQAFWKTALDG
ncbi:MAG: HTH-type transcriptional activator IlvY [Oceanobacter sp.]